MIENELLEIQEILDQGVNDERLMERKEIPQEKCQEHYSSKAKGAFIRSRSHWIEKSSKCFLDLEKARQSKKYIT